jgi:hypothetical protein
MDTLVKESARTKRAYVPTTALAKDVKLDDELMHVYLSDGRIISVPIIWFPILYQATPEQRQRWEIAGGGVSLHWEGLDEDLSVANLMAGVDWQSS